MDTHNFGQPITYFTQFYYSSIKSKIVMNIFSIQSIFTNSVNEDYEVTNFSFDSPVTLLDADIIFWDVEKSESEIPTAPQSTVVVNKWLEILRRRSSEFKEYFELGRNLVITSPSFKTIEIPIIYTSGNLKEVNLISILPITNPSTTSKSGKSIESPDDDVKNYLQKIGNNFRYDYDFPAPKGQSLMYIKSTKYVVSQYFKVGNGIILFLPTFIGVQESKSLQLSVLKNTMDLIEKIRVGHIKSKVELPEWANNIEILGEKGEKNHLLVFKQQKDEIEQKIKAHELKLEEYKMLKTIFTGSGDELEEIVRIVFSEMGFEIEEAEKGRDDLIIHYGDFVAVIEAKGVDGSSGEKHAAQLQKWVSAYHEKHEKEPKGILIANTFRKIPLHERTQEDFPHQMLKYVERMRHCLMTGAQLLYLLLDFRSRKITIEDIVTRLSETVGILEYGNKMDYFDNLPNQ